MRLIDADALIEKSLKDANCYMDNNDIKHGYHNVQCLIYDAPTIDATPIRHGMWEEIDDLDFDTLYRCSVCGEEFYLIDGTPQENQYYYCPCCGSKMDEEVEE